MKKILFVINSMEIGGTRRSLLNLLNELAKNQGLQCHLLIFSPFGEYMTEIPKRITICDTSNELIAMFSSSKALIKRRDYIRWCLKVWVSLKKKINGEFYTMSEIYKRYIKKHGNHYDMVIGFQEGGCNDYTALADGNKRIFWIHNNYENLNKLAHGNTLSYKQADSINFVAQASMDSFKKAMPEFSNKMCLIKNVLPQELIRHKALEPHEKIFKKNTIHLVSVGRIANQKGFDRLVEVAAYLKGEELDFEWIVLGDGEQKRELEKCVQEKRLDNYVRFVGSKANPYPYIKQADLFVLTSRYESQPMVIMEALTIGVPVLSTSFDSVNELVQNKNFAMTVENSTEGIKKGLEVLLRNRNRIIQMKKATSEFQYDNKKIIDELLEL